MTPILAILLAAGASCRMGRVKALLPVDGQPAVKHLAHKLLTICEECVVVTGFHHEAVEAVLGEEPRVRKARNPAPELGQLSSLQTGLRALGDTDRDGDDGWFLFAPVDCLGIDERVLDPLHAAIQEAPTEILLCIPRHGDQRGHPVAARRRVAADFLALEPSDAARTVIHRLRPVTRYVEVEDEAFLMDADHPEDYARFLETRGEGNRNG